MKSTPVSVLLLQFLTLKLDGKPAKDLTGTVTSGSGSEAKDPTVDASFHATLK